MFENAKWITNHDYVGWRLPKADELGPCPMFSKNFDIKNYQEKLSTYKYTFTYEDKEYHFTKIKSVE